MASNGTDDREAHEFLDHAKRFDWKSVIDCLERNPSLVNAQPCGRWSALHQAAYCGDAAACATLIARGASRRALTSDGRKPKDLAAAKATTKTTTMTGESLEELLEPYRTLWTGAIRGARPAWRWTALHQAASVGDLEACSRLLAEGASRFARAPIGGTVPKDAAATDEVAALLDPSSRPAAGTSWPSLLSLLQQGPLESHVLPALGPRDLSAFACACAAAACIADRAAVRLLRGPLRSGEVPVAALRREVNMPAIESNFHRLILMKARRTEATKESLEKEGFVFPSAEELLSPGRSYLGSVPIPGFYGGFYSIVVAEDGRGEWALTCESSSRICDGIGQRHRVTTKEIVLTEDHTDMDDASMVISKYETIWRDI